MIKANGTVISVANIKGGQGKTTIAVNLAIELSRSGHSTCLIDADKQLSASMFTEFRSQNRDGQTGYHFMQYPNMSEKTLIKTIHQFRDTYEFIIVDTHGGDNQEQRMALAACDIVLIPVRPRALDFWALTFMANLLANVRDLNPDHVYKAYSFLSIADPVSQQNRETAELLMDLKGIDYVDSPIVSRKDWAISAGAGLGITEYMDPKDETAYANVKAVTEFKQLFKHILAETRTIA